MHRGEAIYILLIDFQRTGTETKSFQLFDDLAFDYNYLHQLWKIFTISVAKYINMLHSKPG